MPFRIPGQPDVFPNSGSPPFNPNAPDPRQSQQQGGGLLGRIFGGIGGGSQRPVRPGEPQQPQRSGGGISDLLIALGDFGAGVNGQPGPSQILMQQRQQAYQQKRQQYAQNLQLLGEFQKAIEKAPLDQQEATKAKLRTQFETYAGPGSGDLFDSVLGNAGISAGMLEAAKKDPAAQQLIYMGAGQDAIAEYLRSPVGVQNAITAQDQAVSPAVEKKLRAGLFESKNPEVRAALEAAAKDGAITVEDVRALNQQFGTDGPQGTRLSDAELGTLERQQGSFAQRLPGFKTTEAFDKEKAAKVSADLQVETQKRITTNAEEIRDRYERERLRAQGNKDPRFTPNAQAEMLSKAQRQDGTYRQSIAALDRALDTRVNGIKDIELIFQFISGLDETAAREGEVALAQKANGLKGKVQAILQQVQGTGLIGEDARTQLREALQLTRDDIAKDRDLVIGNARDVAKGLGADPSVVKALEALKDYGKKEPAKERRAATEEDVQRVTKQLGGEATDEQILKALEDEGLDL